MTVVTLKGLPPGGTIRIFPAAKVDEWCRMGQQPPAGWAVASPVVTAGGTIAPDLADNQEFMAVLPDGTARRVMSAVTQGGSSPWAPAV